MDVSRLFTQNLKKWRKIAGLSQKELAQKCGTGYSYMRQIESGVGHPSFALLTKLAEALEIEPYKLFYNDTAGEHCIVVESKDIDNIKTDFLKNISEEFDTVIGKLKRGAP